MGDISYSGGSGGMGDISYSGGSGGSGGEMDEIFQGVSLDEVIIDFLT
jgi:hypothetical protein